MLWRMQIWWTDINQRAKPLIRQSASVPALTSSMRAALLISANLRPGTAGCTGGAGRCSQSSSLPQLCSFLPIRDKSDLCGGSSSSRWPGHSWPGEHKLAGGDDQVSWCFQTHRDLALEYILWSRVATLPHRSSLFRSHRVLFVC